MNFLTIRKYFQEFQALKNSSLQAALFSVESHHKGRIKKKLKNVPENVQSVNEECVQQTERKLQNREKEKRLNTKSYNQQTNLLIQTASERRNRAAAKNMKI